MNADESSLYRLELKENKAHEAIIVIMLFEQGTSVEVPFRAWQYKTVFVAKASS